MRISAAATEIANWLAGWSISLPVTEIGWLATMTPISIDQSLNVYMDYVVSLSRYSCTIWVYYTLGAALILKNNLHNEHRAR